MFSKLKNIGPGALVAAAFIGPGTVTVCTLAGVQYGTALIWTLVFSTVATILLQEMSARVGIVSQKGLAEIIKSQITNPVVRTGAILLIFSAIILGNLAYEAGNISGGRLGLNVLIDTHVPFEFGSLLIGAIAFVLLYFGNYRTIEKVLVSLVIFMSLSFLIAVVLIQPSITEILKGIFIPTIPKGSILTVVALIGTTVVPYNLFLHASLAKERWKSNSDLEDAKFDTIFSIVLGGIVSICIVIVGSSMQQTEIHNAADLAQGLEPVFGSFAKILLSVGMLAAGITSAITAPLAAAYVASGCFGWQSSMNDPKFKGVWISILALGVLFSSLGINPVQIIKFAQFANGLLLPVTATFLVWVANKKAVMNESKNRLFQNVVSIFIIAITILLGMKSILSVLNIL